jgi:hypothetical protein
MSHGIAEINDSRDSIRIRYLEFISRKWNNFRGVSHDDNFDLFRVWVRGEELCQP